MARAFFAAILVFTLSACEGTRQAASPNAADDAIAPNGDASTPPADDADAVTTDSGLKYIELKPGDGDAPSRGDVVAVHYTGWLTDGTKFDSSHDRGQPIRFPLGRGNVIDGWDEGIALMRVGGKAKLIIPPEIAYGAAGRPSIPPDSTLVFEVELVDIE